MAPSHRHYDFQLHSSWKKRDPCIACKIGDVYVTHIFPTPPALPLATGPPGCDLVIASGSGIGSLSKHDDATFLLWCSSLVFCPRLFNPSVQKLPFHLFVICCSQHVSLAPSSLLIVCQVSFVSQQSPFQPKGQTLIHIHPHRSY